MEQEIKPTKIILLGSKHPPEGEAVTPEDPEVMDELMEAANNPNRYFQCNGVCYVVLPYDQETDTVLYFQEARYGQWAETVELVGGRGNGAQMPIHISWRPGIESDSLKFSNDKDPEGLYAQRRLVTPLDRIVYLDWTAV
jgi:hypothetical protein